ncbi:MAG: DNA-directed RNA polymerase subunit omega [Candidatus Omnitrophica bacterium]|nr:DNA-directed RNA polymerase subunit omega [Candidatus Omnitrophota bacterium]
MAVSLEDLTKETKSLYGLVICAAGRANELTNGAQPLIQTKSKKISTIALEELGKGKVRFELTGFKSLTKDKD